MGDFRAARSWSRCPFPKRPIEFELRLVQQENQGPVDRYGTNAPYINGGTVENKGVEIGLGWNDQKGDWTYGVNLNLAHNKNEVTQINNKDGYILGPDKVLAENTRPVSRMEVGHPIGYFWAYKTEGVMQNAADVQAYLDKNCKCNAANSLQGSSIQPGDLKFVDVNGDGVINEDDKTEVGNPHPDITMGLSFNVGYKGFDLAVYRRQRGELHLRGI